MTLPDRAVGRPLTDAELDRLEALLDSAAFANTAMRADVLHGFIAAIASAPVPVPADRWLAEALGDAAASPAERSEAHALLQRLYGDVALALLEGRGVDPLLYPGEDAGELDFASWCEGYLAGMSLADPSWSDVATEDSALATLTAPLVALTLDADARGDEWPEALTAEELARIQADAREQLPAIVQQVYDFLGERRPRAEPVRREAPKVGRNDPCPCGSGRKFKRCCGAA